MPKLLKEWKGYYEFRLFQDTPQEIVRYAIYIKIPVIERKCRDEAVRANIKSNRPKKSMMWDIAESFDCWRISIEHLKAFRDFIFSLRPDVKISGKL